jgi:hypothetical protein
MGGLLLLFAQSAGMSLTRPEESMAAPRYKQSTRHSRACSDRPASPQAAAEARARRKPAKPRPAKPASIIAQVDGSGTADGSAPSKP